MLDAATLTVKHFFVSLSSIPMKLAYVAEVGMVLCRDVQRTTDGLVLRDAFKAAHPHATKLAVTSLVPGESVRPYTLRIAQGGVAVIDIESGHEIARVYDDALRFGTKKPPVDDHAEPTPTA